MGQRGAQALGLCVSVTLRLHLRGRATSVTMSPFSISWPFSAWGITSEGLWVLERAVSWLRKLVGSVRGQLGMFAVKQTRHPLPVVLVWDPLLEV